MAHKCNINLFEIDSINIFDIEGVGANTLYMKNQGINDNIALLEHNIIKIDLITSLLYTQIAMRS